MLKSRFPEIIASLPLRLDQTAREGAELVAERAKARVPVRTGALRDAIHVEREGPGQYYVVAGDERVYYGHIVEHGGAYTPAQPFLTPASEESRPGIQAIGAAALRGL